MKKRLFSIFVVLALALGLLPTSALALKISVDDTEAEYSLAPLTDTKYMPVRGPEQTLTAGTAIGLRHITSLDELCVAFADPASDQTLSTYYDKRGADKKCVFSNTSSLALALGTSTGTLTGDSHNVTEKFVVKDRSAQIGTYNVFKTITLNFQQGISVENGDLLFQNCWGTYGDMRPDTDNQRINVVLGAPIVLKNGGRLILDGAENHAYLPTEHSTLTAPAGESAIIVENGGTVNAVYFKVAHGEETAAPAPLIDVQSGGTLNFDTDNIYLNAAPVLDNGASDTPAVSVADGATVTVEAGDFTASGTGPIFDLASGGKLTLEGGTIENSGGQPAITVGSGATVVIPENSKASITSTNGNTAIDLADGSTIQKDGNIITVGTNPADDGASDNYVDNQGNIILGSGGSVTDSSGTTTQLPNGGTVTPEGEVKPTPGPTPPPQPQPDPQPQPQPEDPAPAEPDNDHTVSLPAKTPGGAVKVSPRYAEQGETVTVTVTPDPGYELDHLTVSQRDGRELDLTDKGNGKFTFTMPDAHVRLSAAFRAICQGSPFVDVAESAYYADAVKWAVENGVTGGTTATAFSPNASCTRAQMVTFLWRASGSPVVNHAMSFTDVPADAYYAEAVRWALAQGITSGTTADTFSPNATVTRAQAVTFIYRNVQAQGGGFTGSWMFPCPFTDVPADAYYFESVQWCAMKNITSGTTATAFSPSAPCTRAQIVTFLYRGLTA